jgi:hypothetical protein
MGGVTAGDHPARKLEEVPDLEVADRAFVTWQL